MLETLDYASVVAALRHDLHAVNGVIPLDLPADKLLRDELGIDSLDIVEFVACVEYRYGFSVTDEEWQRLKTLDDIASHVLARANT